MRLPCLLMEIAAFLVYLAVLWVPALILSRVGARGQFFGVHVGPEPNAEAVGAVRGGWLRNVLLLTLAGAVAGLTRFGVLDTVTATVIAQALTIAGVVAAYHAAHLQARIIAVPPASAEHAVVAAHARQRDLFPAVATLIVAACATLGAVYAASVYDRLPARIPIHFDGAGRPDGWASRSWGSLLLIPLTTLVVGGMMALMAWVAARTRFARRSGGKGMAPEVREQVSTSTARFLGAMAILVAGMLTYLSVASLRVALGRSETLGWGMLVLFLALMVFALAGAAVLTRKEWRATRDEHYKAGLFYVNPDDPALFVPKRIGVGWTLNFGNPVAWVVLTVLLALPVAVVVILARSAS